MPEVNCRRCTHCHRWPFCWLHRSCIRKVRCRGCPGWASTQDAAWRRCNTGRVLGSTLTVVTPHRWDKPHGRNTGNLCTEVLTCPDRPRVCQSLRIHSSSHSQRSPRWASCPASHTRSSSWTGWGPGSPATDLKAWRKAAGVINVHIFKGSFSILGCFPHRRRGLQPRGTRSGGYSSWGMLGGSAHLNIFIYHVWDFGIALSAVHTTRPHTHSKVHTHSLWTHLNLELRFCRDYGDLEERWGWKHNNNKKKPSTFYIFY